MVSQMKAVVMVAWMLTLWANVPAQADDTCVVAEDGKTCLELPKQEEEIADEIALLQAKVDRSGEKHSDEAGMTKKGNVVVLAKTGKLAAHHKRAKKVGNKAAKHSGAINKEKAHAGVAQAQDPMTNETLEEPELVVGPYVWYQDYSIAGAAAKQFVGIQTPDACAKICEKRSECKAFIISKIPDEEGGHNCWTVENLKPAAPPVYFLANSWQSCDSACQAQGKRCDKLAIKQAAESLSTCKGIINNEFGYYPAKGGVYRDDNSGCTYHTSQTGWYQIMRKDGNPQCDTVNPDKNRRRVCGCLEPGTMYSNSCCDVGIPDATFTEVFGGEVGQEADVIQDAVQAVADVGQVVSGWVQTSAEANAKTTSRKAKAKSATSACPTAEQVAATPLAGSPGRHACWDASGYGVTEPSNCYLDYFAVPSQCGALTPCHVKTLDQVEAVCLAYSVIPETSSDPEEEPNGDLWGFGAWVFPGDWR